MNVRQQLARFRDLFLEKVYIPLMTAVLAPIIVLSIFKDRLDSDWNSAFSAFTIWRVGSNWLWIFGVFIAIWALAKFWPGKKHNDKPSPAQSEVDRLS